MPGSFRNVSNSGRANFINVSNSGRASFRILNTTTTTSTTTTTTTLNVLLVNNVYRWTSNPGTACNVGGTLFGTPLYTTSGVFSDGIIVYTNNVGSLFDGNNYYYSDPISCIVGTINFSGVFTKTADCSTCA